MEIFAIPIEDKFILYRPLRRLAFVGNRAMADLTLRLTGQHPAASLEETNSKQGVDFLKTIGFLEPDPLPPSPLDPAYRPTTVVLLLTNRCNLRCTYCYADGGEGFVQDLSSELAQAAIDYACQNAVAQGQSHFELVFHGGGEPIQAWKTLQEATIYARSKKLDCKVTMVSNGIWSTRQREWIFKNLDSLSISLDGEQETQDQQRPFASGRGSFKAVMRTIEALDKAKFPYGIRMTATAPWRGRLPKDVRFICEETGCPAMHVEPAFNIRRGEHQGPTQAESEAFVEAFMEAFEIASRAKRQLVYSGARPWLLTRTFCTAPYGALIVNPAGDLVTCYEVANKNHTLAKMSVVGRIVGDQIIVDNQARRSFLAYLGKKQAKCSDCFCYRHCAGDCYTRSFPAEAGNSQSLSPRCIMNREITARILLWYIMAGDGVWRGQGVHPQATQLLRTF